ncbi:MAG: hypothetical protein M1829_000764 [Trizodia sp. TS-e1964]|nr:MAG: hypothetical protein M1829_000764 [Trizodia sp. TS-e1964]
MRFTASVALALAASLSVASPIEKRVATPTVDDCDILNYALTAEYLERKFYSEGLSKFTQADFIAAGFPNPFYANLKEVYADEKTHVDALVAVITKYCTSYPPVNELTYKFPYTDARSFVALSSLLEGGGVSAYLGAAASIVNKGYLTTAGAILTIEARHSSYIRASLGESPFPAPFDTPVDFNTIFSIAAQFITSVTGTNTKLPFSAFPPLVLEKSSYPYSPGSPVTFTDAFKNSGLSKDATVCAVFFNGLTPFFVPARITRGDEDYKIDDIPQIYGQTYIVLSKSCTEFKDENIIAGAAIIEELEFLADSSVITAQQLSAIFSQLPAQTPLSAPTYAPSYPAANTLPRFEDLNINEKQSGYYAPNPVAAAPSPLPPQAVAPPARMPQAPSHLAVATALFAYSSNDAGDLALMPNDRVFVLEYANAEWWKGRNERTGLEGIFPQAYVKVDEQKGAAPAAPAPSGYGNVPLEVSQSGSSPGGPPSKVNEQGKKFGKKLGNAAIFGAGASIGSSIVHGIF